MFHNASDIENGQSGLKPSMYSPLTLAFLGDGVYDLIVREMLLLNNGNMPAAKLHSIKIKLVCAEYQSGVYNKLLPVLNPDEEAVLKRGRNTTGNTVPRHINTADYRKATAVECLFGYLYLKGDMNRINELFELAVKE